MTFEGYLAVGGVEVINTERARGYAESTDCPERWVVAKECDTLGTALGDTPYLYANIVDAPWYDSSLADMTSRFFGVVGLRIDGITNSTRSASQTEGVIDGGVIGRTRKGMRGVRVRATLLARGRDALDYGSEWLSSVFDGNCSQHGDACSTTDAEFFADCPPEQGSLTTEEYALIVNPYRRFLHDIAVTSGPIDIEEFESGNGFFGKTVEWIITSERAWIYGITKQLTLTPTLPSIVQDIPYNLIPYPSAELGAGNVVVATNLSTNPGVEVDATGWVAESATVSGTAPTAFVTSARSTDIGAGGSTASFRVRLLGNNGTTAVAGAVSTLSGYQDVTIPAGTGRRVSLNLWSACLILNGSGPGTVVNSLIVSYEFFNGVTSLGAATTFGTAAPADLSGKAYSLPGVAVPPTATKVRVRSVTNVTWSSSATAGVNSDLRLYVDAVTVSVP